MAAHHLSETIQMSKAIMQFHVDKRAQAALKQRADREFRSVSSLINMIVYQRLVEDGDIASGEQPAEPEQDVDDLMP